MYDCVCCDNKINMDSQRSDAFLLDFGRFFSSPLFHCFCNFESVMQLMLMESWSDVPEEEEHEFPDEMNFSFDALMINRKALVEWDNKVPCNNFEKDGFISERDHVVKNKDFIDLGFPSIFQKSFHLEPSNCLLDSSNSGKIVNSSTHNMPYDSMGEEESESNHSSSLLESRNHVLP